MAKNKRLTNRQFRKFLSEFKALAELYSENCIATETDWKAYEKEYAKRIRYVGRELNSLANEAIEIIRPEKSKFGRPQKLSLQQKAIALILNGNVFIVIYR